MFSLFGDDDAEKVDVPAASSADLELWTKKMKDGTVEVFNSDLNAVVMNYLVFNGFGEAAESFAEEAGIQAEVPLYMVNQREKIHQAVLSGDVDTAVDVINSVDPSILANNPSVLFRLKQLELIKVMMRGNVLEAIECAQEKLGPCIKDHPEMLPEVEETMGLLAFPSLETPEALKLLEALDKRQEVATIVDNALLQFYGIESESLIDHLCKNLLWTQKLLKKHEIKYPELIDLQKGELEVFNGKSGDSVKCGDA